MTKITPYGYAYNIQLELTPLRYVSPSSCGGPWYVVRGTGYVVCSMGYVVSGMGYVV